jgi:hypothetical protein
LRVRHHELGTQFGAIDQKAAITCPRVYWHIGAQLEPLHHPIGPFGDTVQSMVWPDAALKIRQFPAGRGIVVVQLNAELPRAVDVGVVDLDLVDLGMGTRDEQACDPADSEVSHRSRAAATRKDPVG